MGRTLGPDGPEGKPLPRAQGVAEQRFLAVGTVRRSRAIFGRWRLGGFDKAADFQLEEDSTFDELVLPNAGVHLEVMDDRPAYLWMDVNGVQINVHYPSKTVLVRDECRDGWKLVVDRP